MQNKRYFPLHPGSTSSNVLKVMSTYPNQLWRLKDLFAGVKSKKVSNVHAVSDALLTLIRRGCVVRKKRGVYKLMDLDWNRSETKKPGVVETKSKVSKPKVVKGTKKPVKAEENCSKCEEKLLSDSEIRVGICTECQDELGKEEEEEESEEEFEEEEEETEEEETRDVDMDILVGEISSARAKFRSKTGKALDKIVFVRDGGRTTRLLITYTKEESIVV